MALKFDTFRYGGMATPDIIAGSKMILEGLGTPGDLVDKANIRERAELQDARLANQDLRQAKQDALATPGTPEWLAAKEAEKALKMDSMAAEQKWKAEFDPVYQNALAVQKQSIVGSPEYNEAQKTLTKLEQDKKLFDWNNNPEIKAKLDEINRLKTERASQELLAKAIIGVPTEKITNTTITPEQVQQTRAGLESAAVTNAGSKFNEIYSKLTTPSEPVITYEVDSFGGQIPITTVPGKPTMSAEEAQQEALKRVGLLDVIEGKAPVIDESLLPKAGTTSKTDKKTEAELTQAKLDILTKAVNEGKIPATMALEVANKLNPKISQEQILAINKDDREERKLTAQIEGGEFKKAQKSSTGNWLQTYNDMMTIYGDAGSYDRPDIADELAKLQQGGEHSDSDMSAAINAASGVYGRSVIGVNEDGFVESVKEYLKNIRAKEAAAKTKE